MKFVDQGISLEVSNDLSVPRRVAFGLVAAFFLFQAMNYFWVTRAFNVNVLLYLGLFWVMAYLASNQRRFIFSREGVRMFFGPRVYAFFTVKEEFVPRHDIKALAILPYRTRQSGRVRYGLHLLRHSSTKAFDLFGLDDTKTAEETAELILNKLDLKGLPITTSPSA